jgi:hypothetical protein
MVHRLRDVAHQERDAARSLEFFVEMLDRVREDSYYWKWAIIALHNACHGFMVLALEGTWPVRLLPLKTRRKVLQDQYSVDFDDRVYSDHIMGFLDLFEAIQDETMMRQYTDSKAFESKNTVTESMRSLNDLRNQHLHFRAMTRIDYVPAFVPMCFDALEVIDFLISESGNVGWTHSQVTAEAFKERSNDALTIARKRLADLDSVYRDLIPSADRLPDGMG